MFLVLWWIASLQNAFLLGSGTEYGIHRMQCRKDVLFKLIDRNKKLTGQNNNIIEKTNQISLSTCIKKCLDNSNCITINFKRPNEGLPQAENCQLLNILKANGSIVAESGWNHYEPVKQVWN